MNALRTADPLSARDLLYGADAVADLASSLADSGALTAAREQLAPVGASVWAAAQREVASMATDFLNLDLASVAVAGFRKHRELLAAAERTRSSPGAAVVPLGTRDFTVTQRPRIDLVLAGVTVGAVQFELKVTIKVIGVAGVVRNGALVALEGGRCDVTGRFSAAGVVLREKSATVDPRRSLTLGRPIPLGADRPRA